jgi:GMP synthase-like glutamine amidotransferase
VSYTRFYDNPALPQPRSLDLVIAMGGPMSVNDEATLPWLLPEKQFLREVIERRIPVLGVCLGAQLIASTLGSRIYRNPHKEIGWFDIEATLGPEGVFQFPRKCTVFHWHGETFDLPAGAMLLAKSVACNNQAFQIGQHVSGLQFHLEMTPDSASSILINCRDELVPGPYIQTELELRTVPVEVYTEMNTLMDKVLSYLRGTNDLLLSSGFSDNLLYYKLFSGDNLVIPSIYQGSQFRAPSRIILKFRLLCRGGGRIRSCSLLINFMSVDSNI